MISVIAKKDGLYISKSHNSDFIYVTIHVESENDANFSIETNHLKNDFIYPFVEKGKTYSIYLSMMDKNWENYTTSDKVYVKAKGGLGDCSIKYSQVKYDNTSMSLFFSDYNLLFPPTVKNIYPYYEAVIFDDIKNGVNWKKFTYGNHPSRKQDNFHIIDISSSCNSFVNKDFVIQLDCSFFYEDTLYKKRIVFEDIIFSDFHPITNIHINNGTLIPKFSPKHTKYIITGTDSSSQIYFNYLPNTIIDSSSITLNKDNNFSQIIASLNGEKTTYTFTYEYSEKKSFDNEKYIQTFYDDFSEKELNTTKWKKAFEQPRQTHMFNYGWWKDECSYIEDGNLVLEAKKADNLLISGAIDTENIFEQSHGLYEIKFKCQKTSGLWYAFWLMGKNTPEYIGNGAIDEAEIDIWELVPNQPYYNKNLFKSTVHWDAYGAEHKYECSPSYSPSDDFYDEWHITHFIWGENSYKLFLDGNLLWELPGDSFGGMCEGTNYMVISSEFGYWAGNVIDELLPAKMYVDYVKVYKKLD